MYWHRIKFFEGCEHWRPDWQLCIPATDDMHRNAEQRKYFLASCGNDDAVRTHKDPQSITRPNCCTLTCCALILESFQTRIRKLEELAGVGVGYQEGHDFLLVGLPQDHQRAAVMLSKARSSILEAARLHWDTCGSSISVELVEPNKGIRTPSRIDLGLDLAEISVNDQRHRILDAFAPDIARIYERRLQAEEPPLTIDNIDALEAAFGNAYAAATQFISECC